MEHYIKLLKNGEKVLKQYCLNRKRLFYIEDTDMIPNGKNFNICRAGHNWVSKQCNLNILANVTEDEDTKEFTIDINSDLLYQLNLKDLKEFINFLDKIVDIREY